MTHKVRINRISRAVYTHWEGNTGQDSSTDPPGVRYTGDSQLAIVSEQSDVADGVDDPRWRGKIAAGVDVTHPYTRSAVRAEEFTPWSCELFFPGTPGKYSPNFEVENGWGHYPNGSIFNGFADTGAVNSAKTSFVSKAQQYITPFQGGVFLGELSEAIHTIRHPCQGVKKLVSSYLKRVKKARPGFKKATRQRRQRFLSEQWLEVSYGIRPLISDIQSGVKALQDIVNQRANSPCIKGFGKSDFRGETAEVMYNMRRGNVVFKQQDQTITKCVYFGAVRMDLNAPSQFAMDKVGLSLPQFLPTVWELIPWSFLADYFTNIGQIVNAVSFPTSRLAYIGSTTVVKSVRTVWTSRVDLGLGTNTYVRRLSPGKERIVQTRITRSTNPSLIPTVQVSLPTGVGQWTNMLALAVQAKAITPY